MDLIYNVKPGDTTYNIILKNNIDRILCGLFEIDSLEGADLKKEAEEYLLSIGVKPEELEALDGKITYPDHRDP